MSEKIYKLDEIVDRDILLLLLSSAFREWEGPFNVFFINSGEYLVDPDKVKEEPAFQRLCYELRKRGGEELCKDSNRRLAEKALKYKRPVKELCHAGIWDIAIPIIIDDEPVAVILCGQVRLKGRESEGLEKVRDLERKLNFRPGELEELWEQVKVVPEDMVESIIKNVTRIIEYIGKLGKERIQLQQAQQWEIKFSELREKIIKELSPVPEDWEQFWARVNKVLNEVRNFIKAECGLLLLSVEKLNEESFSVKAVAGLPVEKFEGKSFPVRTDLLSKVIGEGEIEQVPFHLYAKPETVCGYIYSIVPDVARKLKEAILVGLDLGKGKKGISKGRKGILLFFLSEALGDVKFQEVSKVLREISFLLSKDYVYSEEKITRRFWLRRVTHQLLAPIHGIVGYAEDAHLRLQRWKSALVKLSVADTERWQEELGRWENSFESMVWASLQVARLARNLSWIVYGEEEKIPNPVLIKDMGRLLIEVARDFQSIARERGLRSVFVDTRSAKALDGKIYVDKELFRQALGNLIDNAVKYANPGTDVIVKCRIQDRWARILVTDYGIRLPPEEVEKVFEEGERGVEAWRRYPAGTGIGLTVAREIIKLHGGTLTAEPSEYMPPFGWQTTFIISLPLRTQEGMQNG